MIDYQQRWQALAEMLHEKIASEQNKQRILKNFIILAHEKSDNPANFTAGLRESENRERAFQEILDMMMEGDDDQ